MAVISLDLTKVAQKPNRTRMEFAEYWSRPTNPVVFDHGVDGTHEKPMIDSVPVDRSHDNAVTGRKPPMKAEYLEQLKADREMRAFHREMGCL